MNAHFISFGCKVNQYETESIKEIFISENYDISDTPADADVIIFNSCTVTSSGDSKTIHTLKRIRKLNPDAVIVLTGCLPQASPEIADKLPEADIVTGTKNRNKIPELVKRHIEKREQIVQIANYGKCDDFENIKCSEFKNKTRAFVKIQDGCNQFCSYCIIPYARGNIRSKSKEDVINEVNKLVDNGYKEVVLTGIHTGHYGKDKYEYNFSDLLDELCKIDNLLRIRISSIEITELDEEFMRVLKNNKKIVDHIHIPLQSGCDKTLKEMNRKYDTKYFLDKINEIRNIRKDISITTDLIVGFPNETDEDFEKTCEFVKKVNFSKIHVFPYSRRKGTKADLMNNQISEDIKKTRVKRMLEISHELEISYMKKYLNKDVEVLVEKYENGYIMGHTSNYIEVKKIGKCSDVTNIVNAKLKEIDYPIMIE